MSDILYVTNLRAVLDLEWQPRHYKVSNRPCHALSIRVKGNADFYHGDTHFSGKTGDIIFFPKMYDYLQVAHEAERIIVLNFDVSDEEDLPPVTFRPTNPQPFLDDFFHMLRIWTEKKPGYEYAVLSILNRVFEAMVSQNAKSRPIEQAVTYIHRYYASPELSVSSLAAMNGVSETYFRKLFLTEVGLSPHRYIAKVRLEQAKHLLIGGYFSVEETALRCGFQNAKNFSTFFRHETGKTPSMFRGMKGREDS